MKKNLLFSIVFLFSACLTTPRYVPQKTPREIVYIFMLNYGTPRIDKLAPYTTEFFRNYKPEATWIIETWKALSELGYRHIKGKILEERIKKDGAIIIASSVIWTIAGKTAQREIYCFIKTKDGWKLDDLIIEEENVESEKYKM